MSSVIAKFSVSEYERMINAGVFDPRRGHNIELIHGELREMFPINFDHAAIVDYLARWSFDNLRKEQATVRIQQPVCCPGDEAVPQPDVAWVKPIKRRPWPNPSDVFLLIEVADSSVTIDRGEKAEIYANEGIADYWLVNIPHRQIEVFRNPRNGVYDNVQVLSAGELLTPLAFPHATLNVAEMFASLD